MELHQWKKEAILAQDLHSTMLNDRKYDRFTFGDEDLLKRKILGILFGPIQKSDVLGSLTSDYWKILYEKDQIEKCNEIVRHIKENTYGKSSYDFAYIIVCVLHEKNSMVLPLFRVRSCQAQEDYAMHRNVFIDHFGRVYKNWDCYLKENTLEMSWLCVPVDGFYSTQYNYQFIDQSKRGQVVNVLNKVSTITSFTSALTAAGGAAMTLFPPTAPAGVAILGASICAGAGSGVYGLGSGIHKIHDRRIHKQSISLKDSESRMCWLNISAGALSFASAGFTKGIAIAAGAGRAIPQSVRIVGNTLAISSLGLSGTGVAVNIYDVSKKGWSNVSAFDVLQISTSVLIFTHSAVTTKLANSIINEAQTNQLNAMKSPLSQKQQTKLNNKVLSLVEEHGPINGKQKLIQQLNSIDNISALWNKMSSFSGLKSAVQKCSPTNPQAVSHQRLQLASANNVIIGNTPVGQLSNMSSIRLNTILFKLSEVATKVFLQLISKIKVQSMVHFNNLIDKFVRYLDQKIAEFRSENPNPKMDESDKNVKEHYENKALKEISQYPQTLNTKKIFSEELKESPQGFIPELNVLPIETYSEYVDIMVDDEDNEKEWRQNDNSLVCICKINKTRETRTIEFSYDEFDDITIAVDKETGHKRNFIREDLFYDICSN